MNSEKFFQSKIFRDTILIIAGLIILVFVFGLGVFVGTKKADFSFKWADQYHRNFGGPQGGFFGDFIGSSNDFTNSNGVFGQIIAVGEGTLTIKDKDSVEKVMSVDNKALITYQKKNIKFSDLKKGDYIVGIGEPTGDGQIEAEFIRVMPAPPLIKK